MIAAPILLGFFTAIGWWGGNKVTTTIDTVITPPAICQQVKEEK